MILLSVENLKHCRWCGIAYMATKPINKDGFCISAHKQAHYRAYKKYVTATDGPGSRARGCSRKRK